VQNARRKTFLFCNGKKITRSTYELTNPLALIVNHRQKTLATLRPKPLGFVTDQIGYTKKSLDQLLFKECNRRRQTAALNDSLSMHFVIEFNTEHQHAVAALAMSKASDLTHSQALCMRFQ